MLPSRFAALVVTTFVALGASSLCACSGDAGSGMPGPEENDSGISPPSGDSGSSPADAAGPGVDAAAPHVDSAAPPQNDAASSPAGDGGLKAFGETCTKSADCESNLCESFRQQTIMLCTKSCTAATQTTDCPNPPSAGTCTPKGYCRFN